MSERITLSAEECLPREADGAVLIGRAWVPAQGGPAVIGLRGTEAVDLTRLYPTTSHLRRRSVRRSWGTGPSSWHSSLSASSSAS